MAFPKSAYIAIADIIAEEYRHSVDQMHPGYGTQILITRRYVTNLTLRLCSFFAGDNPRFDRGRFIAYINRRAEGK